MARIISYQYDDDIKDGDAWIGTEATSRRTKQYTAQAVANYLNINGSISIVGQMTYKYVVTPESETGSFAIFGGGPDPVAFSAVTKLTLSNTDVSGQRVVEFLELLVNSDILISRQSEISTFGYYSIDSYAVNANNPDYYDLSVTFKSGNGSMEAGKIYETQNFTLAAEENISTLQTTIDAGNTYQESPLNTLWTWGTDAITATSSTFTSLLSGKRFKTTLIADGSYTDVLPNSINFNDASGNETSITTNTGLSSNINLQWPSSSGTLALTTDITASPWDTVLGGINYAGGNVGIGIPTPAYSLQVSGTISSDSIYINNTQDGHQIGKLIIDYASSNRPALKSQGGGGVFFNDDLILRFNNNNIIASANHSSDLFFKHERTGDNGFRFQTLDSGDVMRINGAGNVGIGTTSPNNKLTVYDASQNYALRIGNNTANFDGSWSGLAIFNSTNQGGGPTSEGSAAIRAYRYSGRGQLGNELEFRVGGTSVMRFDYRGNVGIGTDSPSERLEVNGNIKASGGIYVSGTNSFLWNNDAGSNLRFGAGGSERMRITSTGNVGIGTTSPLGKLNVVGQAELLGNGFYGLINITGTNALSDYNTANKVTISSNGSTDGLYTGGLHFTRRTFTQQGNYGAGIRGLSVGTVLQDNALELYTSTNTEKNVARLKITSTGNVGIGTTSPTSKLDVAGGDIELDDSGAGIVMRSPDGTKYRITVANGGTLTVTAL